MYFRFLILTVFFWASTLTAQQFNVSLGSDMKILIFGTDNQFTSHSASFNFVTKIEFIDTRNTYFAVGYTYADLTHSYDALYVNAGIKYNLLPKLDIIPMLELGRIARNGPDQAFDVKPLYVQVNIATRYQFLEKLYIDFALNFQLARDLPNRTIRYGGVLSLISPIFTQ